MDKPIYPDLEQATLIIDTFIGAKCILEVSHYMGFPIVFWSTRWELDHNLEIPEEQNGAIDLVELSKTGDIEQSAPIISEIESIVREATSFSKKWEKSERPFKIRIRSDKKNRDYTKQAFSFRLQSYYCRITGIICSGYESSESCKVCDLTQSEFPQERLDDSVLLFGHYNAIDWSEHDGYNIVVLNGKFVNWLARVGANLMIEAGGEWYVTPWSYIRHSFQTDIAIAIKMEKILDEEATEPQEDLIYKTPEELKETLNTEIIPVN